MAEQEVQLRQPPPGTHVSLRPVVQGRLDQYHVQWTGRGGRRQTGTISFFFVSTWYIT